MKLSDKNPEYYKKNDEVSLNLILKNVQEL